MRYFKWLLLVALASSAVFADAYNVNLMWINRSLNNDQKYFCATAKTEEDYKTQCLGPIADWVIKSPKNAPVRMWYDSQLTSQELKIKTIKDLEQHIAKSHPDKAKNILFEDIRDLVYVKLNSAVFSAEVPVYFRADLLRAIVGDHLARKYPEQFTVYADLNIKALSHDEIFDQTTRNLLKKFGFVMAENEAMDAHNSYENAFFILDPKNPSLMQASRKVLVELNLKRGRAFIANGYTKKDHIAERGGKALCLSVFPEVVFVSYKLMLEYYFYLEMAAEIILDPVLEKNLTTMVAAKQDSLNAMVDAQNNPLWRGKPYLFSLLFNVRDDGKSHKFLFDHGFAEVSYVTLIEDSSSNVKFLRHLYLRPIQVSNVAQAQKLIAEEKERRKSIDTDQLFSVHKTRLKAPSYLWQYKVMLHGSRTPLVSLEEDAYSPSLMPIKDVKKPQSSFYGLSKPLVKGDDC